MFLSPDVQKRPTLIAGFYDKKLKQSTMNLSEDQLGVMLEALDGRCSALLLDRSASDDTTAGGGSGVASLPADGLPIVYSLAMGWNRSEEFHVKASVPSADYFQWFDLPVDRGTLETTLASYNQRRYHDLFWVEKLQPTLFNAPQADLCRSTFSLAPQPLPGLHMLGSRCSPLIFVQRETNDG